MKANWFPVQAAAVSNHPKFRHLSHAELGMWLDLRASAELLGGEPFVDMAAVVHVLTARSPRAMAARGAARLVEAKLLDVLEDERVAIHDIGDHSGRYPSEEPEATRTRKRDSRARHDMSRVGHDVEESRVEERKVEVPANADHDLLDAYWSVTGAYPSGVVQQILDESLGLVGGNHERAIGWLRDEWARDPDRRTLAKRVKNLALRASRKAEADEARAEQAAVSRKRSRELPEHLKQFRDALAAKADA